METEYIEVDEYVCKKNMDDKWFYEWLELANQFREWRIIEARKDCIDENGIIIKQMEEYYKSDPGYGWGKGVLKMSRKSMESFLLGLFHNNCPLLAMAKEIKEGKTPVFKKYI